MKPVVAEVVELYLPITETFIYNYLRSFESVRPAVFTHETQNLGAFPFEDLTLVRARRPLERVVDKATRIATGRRVFRDGRCGAAVAARDARVIHGHFGWSAPTTLPLKRDLGLPLATTFYGADMSALPRLRPWCEVYEKLFEQGDAFLVEGGHMRERLVELGCPEEKVTVVHIGCDVAAIPFRERARPELGSTMILMCSSFREKKGVTYGVEAFAKVRAERNDARLVIAGDGPDRELVERCIDECGVRDSVDVLGYVSQARFADLLGAAHVFMAPSVTATDGDSEGGAPTVLLEAQAAGVPVLSTLHADIPEVVPDGLSGHLVPERDSDALADRLHQLLDDPESWARMGRYGRRHVEDSYALRDQARRIEDIYFGLMNGHPVGGSLQ